MQLLYYNTLQYTAIHRNALCSDRVRTRCPCCASASPVCCNTHAHAPLQHKHCRTHTATSMLHRTATLSSTLRHAETYCDTLQHTVTHCNTFRNTATHYKTLQNTVTHFIAPALQHCNTLEHFATHCTTLQHSPAHTRCLMTFFKQLYLL